MNNQDQRGTNTHTPGHEGDHRVHACHNRGRPFPIRHSSSKQRRVHKSSCGAVRGSNPSDDEQLSDDDHHSQGPNSFDTVNKDKENLGAREILTRSCDEFFLDANANFSDSAPSSGSMEPLQDSLYSATDVEIDVNQLIVKITDGSQMQDPSILQGENVQEGNMLESKAQQPDSHVEPLYKSTNDVQVESARGTQFAMSGDVEIEMGEGNFNLFTGPVCDNRAKDVAVPQNGCKDFKDQKGVTPQNSLSIPLSDPLKPKQDDLKDSDSDDEDNHALINQSQLNEKREVLPPDEPVPDCTMERLESCVFVDEESIEGSSGTLMKESGDVSDEIGAFMYGLELEIDWNYTSRFPEERGSDDARESAQQISLPTTETTGGISLVNNECADKSTVSGAEEDNEISRSSIRNKECDISTSVENVSGNTDVQQPLSVTRTCMDDGVNCGSLEGNQDSVSGSPSNLKGPNQQHPSTTSAHADGFATLYPPQDTKESQGRTRVEEIIAEITDCSISQQHSHLQSPSSPTDANSDYKKVKRFHWASYICCCLCVDW